VVLAQIVLLLAIISLALRPPGFTQRKAGGGDVLSLPAEFGDPHPVGSSSGAAL
jgi:hypothetical protein